MNEDYKDLIDSEMNFMRSTYSYLEHYINKYYQEGFISVEQRDKIKNYHLGIIDSYISDRIQNI